MRILYINNAGTGWADYIDVPEGKKVACGDQLNLLAGLLAQVLGQWLVGLGGLGWRHNRLDDHGQRLSPGGLAKSEQDQK